MEKRNVVCPQMFICSKNRKSAVPDAIAQSEGYQNVARSDNRIHAEFFSKLLDVNKTSALAVYAMVERSKTMPPHIEERYRIDNKTPQSR